MIEAFQCQSTYYNIAINEITMVDKNDLQLKKNLWAQWMVSHTVLYFQTSKEYNYGFCL